VRRFALIGIEEQHKMSNGKSTRIYTIVIILLVTFSVLLIFLSLAADPLGIDRTPGFGMIQMLGLLIGITFLTVAAFMYLSALNHNGSRSLQADIGFRLSATGLVFAYVAGLSDLLGIGTHPHPDYERPFVGWLQLSGLGIGIISILVGLLLYYTSRRLRSASSMGFIINGEKPHKNNASNRSDSP